MDSPRQPVPYYSEALMWPQNAQLDLKPEPCPTPNPSPSPSQSPSLPLDPGLPLPPSGKLKSKLLMVLPLAIHLLGSVAIVVTLAQYLNGRHFYLQRRPQVMLADGTMRSDLLGQYNLLQLDITTIVSASIMILRWLVAAWAGPLCWVFFILILSLANAPSSPLLTGSISWMPSNHTLALTTNPTLFMTGPLPRQPGQQRLTDLGTMSEVAMFHAPLVNHFNMAWSTKLEHGIFKRVVTNAARLEIGSTIENVHLPHFKVTEIKWLTMDGVGNNTIDWLWAILEDPRRYPTLPQQLVQSRAALLISDSINRDPMQPTGSYPLLLNIGAETQGTRPTNCDSGNTLLPSNTTIPYFYLSAPPTSYWAENFSGCFAFAWVSYHAGSGFCKDCRVSSYSTVQNKTKLATFEGEDDLVTVAIQDLPSYLPYFGPLKGGLPNITEDVDTFVISLLVRSYSAVWNAWADVYYRPWLPQSELAQSVYKPAVPTLRADVSKSRVYAWLALQLLATCAGLVFLVVQLRSKYPLVTDTDMVAFDLDTTEVLKPNPSSEKENTLTELLRIEPKNDGWKIVAT
ncbi:hypothetical protein B0J17DRAFT_672510 [Rhizoctonia solani]|nr:hypothetical protein B0J17DRAFT_672510 [Rhizoctonia solani]